MEKGRPNFLASETSPYLLQHAFNPVAWRPWNNSAWEIARQQDRLVIVSIGYSACHWCHVMERESFEDEEVAAVMNQGFVSIKVDREERPDVDQIYMDAVQIVTGRGGWPLNAICLPDGRPVYAATYFPKEHWLKLLRYFENYYRSNRDELEQHAANLTNDLTRMDLLLPRDKKQDLSGETKLLFQNIEKQWDQQYGGRKGAPKFMMPAVTELLLLLGYQDEATAATAHAHTQLQSMALGGIYDQVGGGFARYSVDDHWEIPHFEKMLYDNAQLISLYAHAFQSDPKPLYKEVVQESSAFLERELQEVNGGFFSAIDADSDGREGAFYVWKYETLQALLGEDFSAFCENFKVSRAGNFEGENHLVRINYQSALPTAVTRWKALLLKERGSRSGPSVDFKVLCGWNALAVKAYADAFSAFQERSFFEKAIRAADLLMRRFMQPDNSLWRSFHAGESKISGFLEDYALAIQALIEVYQISFIEKYLYCAKQLADYVIQHFYDAQSGLFFYTSDRGEKLIARKKETQDNVIPSSNSVMCRNLWRLSIYFRSAEYADLSARMLLPVDELVVAHPMFYANWAQALLEQQQPVVEIVVTGKGAIAEAQQLLQRGLPFTIMGAVEASSGIPFYDQKPVIDQAQFFVCKEKVCAAPVATSKEALELLRTL